MATQRENPSLLNTEHVLHSIAEDLSNRFAGIFAAETVDRYVFESYTVMARTSTITSHLPSLTERFARDRLTALTQSKGAAPHDVPEVLLVCIQNTGRSQMAAALLDHYAAGRIHVRSAGSTPGEALHPRAVDVMRDIGIDLTSAFPKPLTDDVVRAADVVITMGCGDACPIYPGKRYEDWDLHDPTDSPLEQAREIQEEIDVRVRAPLNEILPAS